MKKIGKKLLACLLSMGIGCTSSAYASVLHSIKTEETITSGAVHINEQLLMPVGWRNVNVLRIDLTNSNVSVAPLESGTSLERQTISQLVESHNAVAGVNADYFDMSSYSSPSLGMLIEDGVLSHGYNSNYSTLGINKNMATFTIDNNNMPSMAYYGVTVKINANGNFVGGAGTKNVVPNSVTKPIVLDRSYYQTTNNIVAIHKTLYTVVVENGMVTYQTRSGESVAIPENGYVIMIPESLANEYYAKLPIGSSVEIQETLYLNDGFMASVSNLKLGIGGSGLIMKNGEAFSGSAHAVTPGSNVARTVVATVQDSNDILLITIDNGNGYIGINQTELIELLKRYHVKDAMYLDGGGSTTFVARNEGSFSPTLQNHPSDGSQRKVINGIGVFTTSETGSLAHLQMTSTSKRTFVGENISLSFKGTDENYNPVMVDPNSITYSVIDGAGDFSGNIFTPTSSGRMLITAQCGTAQAAVELEVSEKPVGLLIEPSLIQIDANSTKEIQVYGVDPFGYKIPISADKVTWTSDHGNIGVTNHTVVSKGEAVGKVTANYKGAIGQAGVIVGNTTVPVDSFETNSASWGGDTNGVTGSVLPCNDPAYHGSRSLKMTYTFKPSSNRQMAYTVFNTPIVISQDAASVNMWLYGKQQGHTAKLELVDSAGKTYYVKLVDSVDFAGWKYVSSSLPVDMALPAKVTKFFMYANSTASEVKTAVYLDHMSITRGFRDSAGTSARADYLFDPYYKPSLQAPIGSQYIINVTGPTRTESMVLGSDSISQMSKKLASGASLVIKASSKNSQLSLGNQYTYNNTYQAGSQGNTQIIMVGTGSGGMRATDPNGWTYVNQSIANSQSSKNIILITSCNPLTQFKDAKEGKAFHDYLVETRQKTGQNIFVVYEGGTTPEVRLEEGIRYIRTNGINVATDNYQDGSFVKFKMDGDAVYYTIEKFS